MHIIPDFIPLLSLPGGSEWLVIALVVLLLFGGSRIPALMKSLGRGVRSFKEGLNDAGSDSSDSSDSSDGSDK